MASSIRWRWLLPLLGVTLYAVALAVLLARHEMWRDELQAWMLARDSSTLLDLWRNTRYEGHPLLWHTLLFPLAHAFGSPVAMQVLHWLLATAGAALVLLRAPFPLWVRLGIVFSYLPLYEYGVISRNYQASVLGVWLFCAGMAATRGPWIAVAGTLVVANASPVGVVMTPALAAAIALNPAWRRQRYSAAAVLLLGIAAAVLQCLPASDYEHARRWFFTFNERLAAFVFRGFTQALFPVPTNSLNFWCSSSFLPPWPLSPGTAHVVFLITAPLVLGIVAGVAHVVKRSRHALVIWVLGFAGLLAFFYVKLPGQIRHFGAFWVLLVAALWIACAEGALSGRAAGLVLAPALVAGVWASAIAARWEWRSPFSGARGAAEAILGNGLQHAPIVGGMDYQTSAVAGFLPGGRLYYPSIGREGSFMIWNFERMHQDDLTHRDIVGEALRRGGGGPVVLLTNAPLAAGAAAPCRQFFHSGPTIDGDEELWGYVCRATEAAR